jgi:hypothetical protein
MKFGKADFNTLKKLFRDPPSTATNTTATTTPLHRPLDLACRAVARPRK